MRIDQMIANATDHLLARLLRRVVMVCAIAIFVIVAIYHFTTAGMIALQLEFGDLDTRLIIGGIYATLAVIGAIGLWAMRAKGPNSVTPALNNPRELQIVMLVEAVMLGYSLARKSEPTR
jgi:protein-S-isoprenylcysteine O-methyltransferase Ste14